MKPDTWALGVGVVAIVWGAGEVVVGQAVDRFEVYSRVRDGGRFWFHACSKIVVGIVLVGYLLYQG